MSKQQKLNQLAQRIIDNDVCLQLRQGATQLVPGAGNPDADILFIGEAPGKKEDIIGEPFVGAAGRFLDDMLASIGLDRDQIYITNIVKYRPPQNRDPLPEEIEAFMPYLLRQIDIIDPRLVVTLGRFSMNVFIPEERIGRIHGQPKRIEVEYPDESAKGTIRRQLLILPLYHPAAALYNGGQRQLLYDDFARIPETMKLVMQ